MACRFEQVVPGALPGALAIVAAAWTWDNRLGERAPAICRPVWHVSEYTATVLQKQIQKSNLNLT
jgi:hypothetical protein